MNSALLKCAVSTKGPDFFSVFSGSRMINHWVAIAAGQVIEQSREFDFLRREERIAFDQERKNLVYHLVSAGWEPTGFDEHGNPTTFRRHVSIASPSVALSSEPTYLLQQLANLRDASILTEEEFQNKKAEILKRM